MHHDFDGMTDEEIALLAQQGDADASEYLLNKYKNFVRSKARSYFLVGADHEDIVQEGMIGLFKAFRDFRPDKLASFHAFAEICVTRQIITAIKTALGSVRAGQKLIIFPQGTRHAAEGETKKGAAMLAVKTRAPILPMYITEGKRFRCRATVVIGKPFTPDPKQKDYGLIADDILRRIYALKEQV